MIEWSFVVTDLDGTVRGFLEAQAPRVTRTLNGGLTFACTLPTLDPVAPQVLVGSRAIRAYRNGVLRFHGPVTEPLDVGEDALTINAASPALHYLPRRFLEAESVWTNHDAGQIARALITAENTRSQTRLDPNGNFQSTQARTVTFEARKSVAECIKLLVEMEGGFYWRETPVEAGGFMTRFDVSAVPGVDATAKAIFEYGRDTLGNLESFRASHTLPRNGVVVMGARGADGSQTVATAEDAASVATHGLLERVVAATDVQEAAVLQEVANEELRPGPPASYAVAPISDSESPEIYVPSPWDDFDVGDTVRIRADHGALQVDTTAEVVSFTVDVSDDSRSERLSSLVLQELA